jgi:macrolide transport system ATP-binding/permease protein
MLEARSLTKYYNHTAAIRNVSFSVLPGEILGYLGPNGAGKSTTVKILTGLIEPSEGQIFYQGRSVHDDFTAFQRRIGYVPEEAHLYPHLSGREYLQLAGRLRGIPRRVLEPKMDEFLRLFSLWNDRHAPLSSYSKGMRQKILLSAALLHNPDILILDEPFSGLDTTSALMLRSLLRALAKQGKIILFSSHVLEVVEKVCSKVLILRKGEVVAYDSIERLQELMSQPSLEGVFAQLVEAEDGDALAGQIINAMGGSDPGPPQLPVEIGLRLYRKLAGAFPQEFQNVYGDELLQVTEAAIEPIWRRHGVLGLARLLLDIAIRVPMEYLAEFRQDLRYGLRALIASPGFTAVALISLSLGICIATCAFSEMNGMALRTLPGVQKPGELVALQSPTSYPLYRRFREQADLFKSTMAYAAPVPFGVALGNSTERIWGHLVSASYFSTLGVQPAIGTFFSAGQERSGQAPLIVVSHRFWRDRLGADQLIIGKIVRINGQPSTVIGVAPVDFLGASPLLFPADIWMPAPAGRGIAPELADNALERRDATMFFVVGRLKAGIPFPRAEAELDAVAQQFERDRVDADSRREHRRISLVEGGKLFPLRKQDLPFFTSFFTIVAALVTLIACSNVVNMMFARAARRRREIAVRLAMGASRGRLIRQLLTESMLLALAAGVIGFLASLWLMTLASQVQMPFPMPVAYDLRPDARVLALTFFLTLCTGLLFGLAPALQATRADLTSALKEGGNLFFGSQRQFSLRNLLIVWQVAGSLTLLVILGLLSLGIQTTLGIQAAINPKNLYSVALDPVRDGYSGAQAAIFLNRLLDRVKALPSVKAATLTETVPVSIPGAWMKVSSAGDGERMTVGAIRHVIGSGYFETTGIPVLSGRSFRKQDEAESSTTAIISEALASQLWQGKEPVGRSIDIGNGEVAAATGMWPASYDYRRTIAGSGLQRFEVIGVAANVSEGVAVGKPRPAIYFPLRPSSYSHPSLQGTTLMVRTIPGVDALSVVRREISAIDERIMPVNAHSMEDQIGRFMAPLRMAAWTYALIGAFGLILAGVGLAGVTAYSVAQRTREIGIRIALGARSRAVLSLVMKEGFVLIMAGMAVGMCGAWAGARMLSFMNSSVGTVTSTSTSDPIVLIGAPFLLALLALIACYVPARRSMRIDPAVALRQE